MTSPNHSIGVGGGFSPVQKAKSAVPSGDDADTPSPQIIPPGQPSTIEPSSIIPEVCQSRLDSTTSQKFTGLCPASKYGQRFDRNWIGLINLSLFPAVNFEPADAEVDTQFAFGAELGLRFFNPGVSGPLVFGGAIQLFHDLKGRSYVSGIPWLGAGKDFGWWSVDFNLGPILGGKITEENPGFSFLTGLASQVNFNGYSKKFHLGKNLFTIGGSLHVSPDENNETGGVLYLGTDPITFLGLILTAAGFEGGP